MSDMALDDLEGKEEEYTANPLNRRQTERCFWMPWEGSAGEERQIVLLHAAAGMKHREVAEALELPLATVLSKYNRSMKKLQHILKYPN